MSFEQPLEFDAEQKNLKTTLEAYFTEVLEGLEEGGIEEGQAELQEILDDLEHGNFESASLYLENELERLKERRAQSRKQANGDARFERALAETQKLWNALNLSNEK